MHHAFWGEPDVPGGLVLVAEVSAVNDDNTDNRFHENDIGRVPAIEEREEPLHLLSNEYPPAPSARRWAGEQGRMTHGKGGG